MHKSWTGATAARIAALSIVCGAVAGAAAVALGLSRLPAFPDEAIAPGAAAEPEWPPPAPGPGVDWSVFRAPADGGDTEASSLSRRFRLAGTFFEYGIERNRDIRKAILDDLAAGAQRIVTEADVIDGVEVVRILRDRVILRQGAREETLTLSFSQGGGGTVTADPAEGREAEVYAGGENRFGLRRVGERRWVFNRGRLLDYYQELMNEPERLLQVFDSMKPLYDENRKITGYQLGIEGEGAFFKAVGLREGDVVRTVNSMPMTNRNRAEYFIKEFVADRANAFVLEVERKGEPARMIYQMR